MNSVTICDQDMECRVSRARSWLETSSFIVAVTGAGISMASGLPLVNEAVEGVGLREVFRSGLHRDDPLTFFKVYRRLLREWRRAEPNAAHIALAESGVWIVTQNIDGLHRDAGSARVIEMHGNLRELRCSECEAIYGSEFAFSDEIPKCPQCWQVLCPGFTFEGEEIRHYSRAVDWVGRADTVLVIGTALEMHPVREVPQIAQKSGANLIWVNEKSEEAVPRLLSGVTMTCEI